MSQPIANKTSSIYFGCLPYGGSLCRLGMHFLETKDEDAELKPGNELNGKDLSSRLPKMYLEMWFKSF
jgi:hypothetical protein